MKLLVLASAGGDAHQRALHAFVASAAAHYDVRVLAPVGSEMLRPIGIPVESWQPGGLFDMLRSVGALHRAVEHHAPGAIHAVGWTAAAVALGALSPAQAAKTIVTLLDPIGSAIPEPFAAKRLPELLRRAAFVTAAYRTLATDLIARFGIAPERVEVIPHGVAPQLPGGIARPAGRAGPVVGYVARPDWDQPRESVLDAVAQLEPSLPDVRLWVAAAGPLQGTVRGSARSRHVWPRVTFFDDPPPPEFFAGLDLLVVPHGRDGVPYALPQALVDGVPVVATNEPGLADTLASFETGWLVPDGAAGLAAGIEDAWPRIDAAWAGAQAQRPAAAAEFDPSAIAGRMLALYERVGRCEADEEAARSQDRTKDAG